jgi:uncharacterized small protein (DUF1192 family)
MPADSRSRMISFRLTEEEHRRFREICFSQGIRSVSELARAAINHYLSQPAKVSHDTLEYRVSELEGRLKFITQEIRRIGAQVPATAASAAAASSGNSKRTASAATYDDGDWNRK